MSSGISLISSLTALASLSSSSWPWRVDLVRTGREQHFRLEDETVADDADIGTVAEDLAQAPEEVRAIARQLLNPLGESDIEALAEVGDRRLALLVALFRGVEGGFERRDLAPQRRDLLVEKLDLGERLLADVLLVLELGGECGDAAAGGGGRARLAVEQAAQRSRSPSAAVRLAWRVARLSVTSPFRRLFQRQELGQFLDLGVEAVQHRVLAGDLAAEQELHQGEDRQEEDEDEEKVGQNVDESRPVFRAADAATACHGHRLLSDRRLQRLGNGLQEHLHFALLLGLGLDPASDHLLLAPHVLDEALDALGEVGHGGGGTLGRADRRLAGGRHCRHPGWPATGVRSRREGLPRSSRTRRGSRSGRGRDR